MDLAISFFNLFIYWKCQTAWNIFKSISPMITVWDETKAIHAHLFNTAYSCHKSMYYSMKPWNSPFPSFTFQMPTLFLLLIGIRPLSWKHKLTFLFIRLSCYETPHYQPGSRFYALTNWKYWPDVWLSET